MSSTVIHLSKATFTLSAPDIRRLPADSGIEVAFAGRSNAGKSSALNTLTNQRSLARTSKTPGRTQLINIFEIAGCLLWSANLPSGSCFSISIRLL